MVAPTLGANPAPGPGPDHGVVEIPLLLTARQAAELIELSRHRGQSVGEILRGLIRRELAHDLSLDAS